MNSFCVRQHFSIELWRMKSRLKTKLMRYWQHRWFLSYFCLLNLLFPCPLMSANAVKVNGFEKWTSGAPPSFISNVGTFIKEKKNKILARHFGKLFLTFLSLTPVLTLNWQSLFSKLGKPTSFLQKVTKIEWERKRSAVSGWIAIA